MTTANIDFAGIANGESLGGAVLTDWTLRVGAVDIYTASEAVRVSAAAGFTMYSYDAITPSGDMQIEMDVVTTSAGATALCPAVSVQTNGHCVFVYTSGTDITLFKYVGGAPVSLATGTISPYASPKTMKLRRVGNVFSVYDGADALVCSATDATLTGGYCGVGAYYTTASDTTNFDNITLGDYTVVGLQLDSAPTEVVAGTAANLTVSNAGTAPTTGNVEVRFVDEFGPQATIDSVTGSGPWVINFTFPVSTPSQFSDAGYALHVGVDVENTSSGSVKYSPADGYKFTDLIDPSVAEGSLLQSYEGSAPVTGDQGVYEALSSPSNIPVTMEADGEWVFDSEPTESQTVSRYVIQANGTIGTEADVTYVYTAPVLAVDSVDNATPQPGDQITFQLSNKAGDVTVTSPSGVVSIDSQDASSATITVPNPMTHGDKRMLFNRDEVFTLDDGSTSATINLQIQPETGYLFGQVVTIDPDGAYANDVGLLVGMSIYAQVLSGDVVFDITTGLGAVTPAGGSVRYAIHDEVIV